jgi:hypothetical protein
MGKDEDEQPSRSFKVEDRRRFVDDAAPEREEAAPRPAAAEGHDHAHPEHADHDHSHHDHGHHHDHDHDHAGHDHSHDHAPHEMNFTTFVMGLSTQALMHLGEIADPEAPHAPDLGAAKQMIDLLGILREKTKGNLEPAEEQLLSSMLYDLRMRYVEVSRQR